MPALKPKPRRAAAVSLAVFTATALFAGGYRLGATGKPGHPAADIHPSAARPDNRPLQDCRSQPLSAAATALDEARPEPTPRRATGAELQRVKQALKTLPFPAIVEKASEITAIPVETIRSMTDPQAFVENLIDVAAKDILDAPSERNTEEPLLGPVVFYGKYGPAHATTSFPASEKVIYAALPDARYGTGQVFVKWYRADDRKILLFRQYPVSQLNNDFIWLRDFSGFEPGHYRVEIYRPQQDLPLLASGDYWVFPGG